MAIKIFRLQAPQKFYEYIQIVLKDDGTWILEYQSTIYWWVTISADDATRLIVELGLS